MKQWISWRFFERWINRFHSGKKELLLERQIFPTLYDFELHSLEDLLRSALLEEIFSCLEGDGHIARIYTVHETIARISVLPKGEGHQQTFVLVEMDERYDYLRAWFQAAFFKCRVRFGRPILLLQLCQIEKKIK